MSKGTLLLAMLMVTQSTYAAVAWSSCQTITGVSDYRAYDGAVYFPISPGIPGCTNGGLQRVRMTNGLLGVTGDTLKGGLAIGLIAFTTKVPVQFAYDNITCDVQIVAIGGYAGTCQ
jgi:hypothetical protein